MTRRVIYEKSKKVNLALIKRPICGKVELLRMGRLPERGIL